MYSAGRQIAELVTIALTGSAKTTSPNSSRPPSQVLVADEIAIDALLKTYERPKEPGCAVGVYRGGQVYYAGAYGLADVEGIERNTAQTSINIGSIGKQFTAAGLVLLAQEGKLSLDDDVRNYIPELPDYGEPIPIRRLLSHTSGIRDYRGLLNLAGHRNQDVVRAPRILEIMSLQRGLSYAPGEQTLYSNGGYFLAAVVIERLSGQSFQAFMRKRILEPLGMMRSRFKGDTQGLAQLAKHHSPSGEGPFASLYEGWEEKGPGDLYSSIEDLAQWDASLHSARPRWAAVSKALKTRETLRSGQPSDYGLGLKHGFLHGERIIGHTGGSEGSQSSYQHFPDAGLSIVALCNRSDGPANQLVSEVAKLVLPATARLGPPPFVAQYAGRPSAPTDRWHGAYHIDGMANVVQVIGKDHGLAVELPGVQLPLKAVGGDVYQLIGGPPDTFVRFEEATGRQPRRIVPLNSDESPMLAFTQAQPTSAELRRLSGDYVCPELATTIRIGVASNTLTAHVSPHDAEVMRPLGQNQFAFERLIFTFDDPVAGASPGFRLDQWRARGMRCSRKL